MSLTSTFAGSTLKTCQGLSKKQSFATATRQVTTMAKKKGVRLIVTLECTEARPLGKTPSRYTTQKNRRNTPDRLELRKYNRYLRKHTLHREIK